jgi:hypothetical protein
LKLGRLLSGKPSGIVPKPVNASSHGGDARQR